MSLVNKTIALVCPKFYGYEDYIAGDLKDRGATVYLIYENLDWVKVSYRLVYVYLPGQKTKLQSHYYEKKLNEIVTELDYFIAIRGSSLNPEIMTWIRGKTPKSCQFIMYQWDGVKNNKTAIDIAPFFDRVLTFDQGDSKTYKWIYRPLFYLPQFADTKRDKDIDVLFICALHSNRAKVLNQLKNEANKKGFSLKAVVHLNRILYYKYKYINKKSEVIDADVKDLTFNPLTIEESYKLYSRSKVVVDYTNTNQTGFTMRTIESLGNGCKLITNNGWIRSADFYDERNIYVYDEDAFSIPGDFISTPYVRIPNTLYEKYSLKSWIDDLIGD